MLYLLFTAAMFAASALVGVYAWRADDLPFYAATIGYGLLLEKLVILHFENYTYPSARMLDAAGIPLAIGFGWSAVIYSGFVTGRRFGLADRHLPVWTALYAVHLDLAMDAVAIRVPYWQWTTDGAWFGVPLGNFLGWYLVALLYTAAYLAFRRRTDRDLAAALGAVPAAVVALLVLLELYTWLHAEVVARKAVLLLAVLAASLLALRRADLTPRPLPRPVTAAVFVFHGFFLGVLLVEGYYESVPALLPLSLAMTGIGAAVHLLPHVASVREARGGGARAD